MRWNLFWADAAADLWHDNKDINNLGNDNIRPLLGYIDAAGTIGIFFIKI